MSLLTLPGRFPVRHRNYFKRNKSFSIIQRLLLATQPTEYLLPLDNVGKEIYEKPLPPAKHTFRAADAVIRTAANDNRTPKPSWDRLIFGHHCSDHMVEIHWNSRTGWARPQIVPVRPLCLHPFAKVLHYAPEVFEGMKAYRGSDGRIRLFRPELNMIRMRLSAARVCLPDFDGQELLQLLRELLHIDDDWVPPHNSAASLYIRPTLIATEPTLGVSPTTEAILFIVTGPVGPYFATGFKPVSLLADTKYVRAWPCGSGDRKIGANYAPTLLAQVEAIRQGHQQMLWLFGPDDQLTEVGTMNIFVLYRDRDGPGRTLVTPPLSDGLILPGVTRHSLLELLRTRPDQVTVVERTITMSEVEQLSADGRLLEIFGAGTACIVCPVGKITFHGRTLNIPEHEFASRLFQELLDIQYGKREFRNWTQTV